MERLPIASPAAIGERFAVKTGAGVTREAEVLSVREQEAGPSTPSRSPALGERAFYVHYVGQDSRLDEWVPEARLIGRWANGEGKGSQGGDRGDDSGGRELANEGITMKARGKRKRMQAELDTYMSDASAPSTPADAKNKRTGKKDSLPPSKPRNIDRVIFGSYDIRTWYHSPYPIDDDEWPDESGRLRDRSGKGKAIATDVHASSSTPAPSGELAAGRVSTPHTPTPITASFGPLSSKGKKKGPNAVGPQQHVLWVCDGCFKYMLTAGGYAAHKKSCTYTHPPGRKVYQRGAHIIWEVDGSQAKLYSQCLSLFGKLFIDHKTIYFDVEPFLFYVLTDATSKFDHVLGFFSKEKISYDDYNLACIIVFPPYQKKSYGTLLIEFSYYLSLVSPPGPGRGSPERPLSDLGLKGYHVYWTSVLLRTFQLALDHRNTSVAAKEARRVLTGEGTSRDVPSSSEAGHPLVSDAAEVDRAKRRYKGFEGEVPRRIVPREEWLASRKASFTEVDSPHGGDRSGSTFVADANVGSVNGDSSDVGAPVTIRTSLSNLSLATNLRTEDIWYALSEAGLLDLGIPKDDLPACGRGGTTTTSDTDGGSSKVAEPSRSASASTMPTNGPNAVGSNAEGDEEREPIVISGELVERIANERRVKPMVLDTQYVIK